MRRIIVGLVVLILLSSLLTLGCFEDSGNGKYSKVPIADAGPGIGVISLTSIEFDGTSSEDPDGEIKSFDWDFGDSTNQGAATSNEEKPKYTYNYPGTYTVTLTVTDDSGATAQDTLLVTVKNRKPVVDDLGEFAANPYEIIYLNVSAVDHDGYIRSFEWDFDGDDVFDWYSVTFGSTTHFFEEPGNYSSILKVMDNSDEITIVNVNITINELIEVPPIADAGLNQTAPIGNMILKGTGFDPDGRIMLYEWDFDGDDVFDWNSAHNGITNHYFSDEGKYIAKLRVTDDSGLTAVDVITIIVNNSIIAKNVSAEIYIDWDDDYDYIIHLNDSINTSQFKVVITEVTSGWDEEFHIDSMKELNQTRYVLSSVIKPMSGRAIQVQVFYYNLLIGARNLNIVNLSSEFFGFNDNLEPVFDFEQILDEYNRGEAEHIRLTSIGEISMLQKGDLVYTTLHGTGSYFVEGSFDGGESELNVNSTDLWINITMKDNQIISESISMIGYGKMIATYEDDIEMDIDILKMRLVTENRIDLENYLYGEGTFTGTTTDPSTGLEMELTGDVFITTELLGHGMIKNWAGEEFSCSIQYTNITFDGVAKIANSAFGTPIKTNILNTSWNANYEKYSNNTVYYEYNLTMKIANLDYFDSGSDYPEGNPTIREKQTHIIDAMKFETPRPSVFIGEDKMILSSNLGVQLQITAKGENDKSVLGQNQRCVELEGEIIKGGSGELELVMISRGDLSGLVVDSEQNYFWKDEQLYIKQHLKSLRK